MLKIRSISLAVQKLSGKENETFGCCDLDPMTFTSEHDLDMVVAYLHAKIRSSGSKVIIGMHTFGCCDLDLGTQTRPRYGSDLLAC